MGREISAGAKTEEGSNMRFLRRSGLVLASIALLSVTSGPVRAGDPDVAKLLFDKGEKAYRAKNYEEAESYYARAIKEHSPYPEAAFGHGEALEKLGRTNEAIDAYLLCKDQLLDQEKLSYTDKRMLDRASKAVQRLGAGFEELAEIDKAFVKDCIAFGRKYFHSDPGWAKKAFQHAIGLQPGNRLIQGYLDRLADAAGPAVGGARFEPLIKDDGLTGWDPGVSQHWSCKAGVIVCDPEGSPGLTNLVKTYFEGKFTLSGRFRITDKKGVKPAFGIMFGMKKDSVAWGMILATDEQQVSLTKFEKGDNEDLRTKILPRFDSTRWHEVKLEVTPGKVVGSVDGHDVFQLDGEAANAFDGPAGIFGQQCRLEVKDVGVQR
jgi:tetratricopeptide (TPR) repeat protein